MVNGEGSNCQHGDTDMAGALTFTVTIDPRDRAPFEDMMRAGGFGTTETAVQIALWRLASHLGVAVRPDHFLPYPVLTPPELGEPEADATQGGLF